jgi:hypothetical protein
MASFSADYFEKFCAQLRIATKEKGEMPLRFLGSQRYLTREISRGLQSGVHTFVVLKGRQMGISTIMLAFDLYWLFSHQGLQGALVTDTDENRTLFRSYLVQYIDSLKGRIRTPPIAEHNRSQIILANRSRLAYMVAGVRKQGNLGRGHAVNFLHATECSSWGDEEGLASLHSTLAQSHPSRLYVFESTARGYNLFYEMWEGAKTSATQRAIFIGWWRNEIYQLQPTDPGYRMYWDGQPTSDEKIWAREIMELYGHSITDRQLAWWRWKMAEEIRDETLMLQEYPPTEDYAFQLSGSKFFSSERINMQHKQAMEQERRFFRYEFGIHFEQTKFIETQEHMAELSIWEFPVPEGVYVLGADPAYGSSEWADEFSVSVWRAYADRLVQVAELGTTALTEAQFAWVLAHLAGNFKPCMVVLEMQGPGGAVFNELQNLKRFAGMPNNPNAQIYEVAAGIRDYLWRRVDSLGGGMAYQFQTTSKEKLQMMSNYRSYFERDMLGIRSPELTAQMRNIRREGDKVGGDGRAKDDRVIAAGLAIEGWNKWLMHEMAAQGRTYAFENRPRGEPRLITPLENAVMGYLRQNGIEPPRG